MQDTADTGDTGEPQAAGQPADATPAAPEQPTDPVEPEGAADPWADPDAARKEIEKLRRQAAGYRTKLREAEPKLNEYQQWLDSQKTEQQKLAEQLAEVQRERDEARLGHARLMAAAAHNIPADLIDRIAGTTSEEIDEAAKVLAESIERLVAERQQAAQPRAGRTRPVESLTPGAAPSGDEPLDVNALLRARLGRG